MRPRRYRRAASAAMLALALTGVAACGTAKKPDPVTGSTGGQAVGDSERFPSAPSLRPARLEVTQPAHGTAPGYLFAAPRPGEQSLGGPMMFDDKGQLAWFHPLPRNLQAIDVRVQDYRGKPAITYGVRPVDSHSGAYDVVLDSSYREVAHVRAGDGDGTDLHDFVITPQNTALVLGYRVVGQDLSAFGGPADGEVLDGTVQEVDIASGRVLWRWSALAHIPLSESMANVPKGEPWDAYHLNSIDEDGAGNMLVSARHTSTVYEVNRQTGEVRWRLGGKSSGYKLSSDERFHFQHDAQFQPDGVSVFDNGATNATKVESESRGLHLRLDPSSHTVSIVHSYTDPDPIVSESQGTYQTLPDGHALLGWGKEPVMSEFSADGDLLFEARFADGDQQAYSAHRAPWTGTPSTKPSIAVDRDGRDATLRASWNGATEVARWQVLGGSTPQALTVLGTAKRAGFETVLHVRTARRYLAVRALDRHGRPLAASAPTASR